LLKVSFLSNGADGLSLRDTYYAEPPADGLSDTFDSKVLVEESTTRVGVRVDVMTCKAASCPSPSAATPSDFITNSPAAHRAEASLSPWSSPGTIGYSATDDVYSKRRPALEDQDWLNNVMFTSVIDSDPDGILDSEDTLPVMVDTISPASVPSFAPGFAAISAAGLFVAGLMLASRRREEEEELESLSLVDDEQAVSPVIATILMVAITVVLSGVVYVWASDLADQPSKSVPRIAFKVEKNSPGLNGYWSIIVTSAKEPIATQATVVMLEWVNGSGSQLESFRLDNTEGIYGFAPINSESFVTFSDSIECDSPSECTSTYGDGDAIHIKMSDESGYLLDDGIRVTLKYVPIGAGNAFVLKTFNLEI
jgi:flagellin-like protein